MLKYTVSRNKDGILGENPETKNIYMQVIPRGRRLHVCSQKVKEKAFLTWNENTMKNDVSGGKKPEKNKKNKGAGSWGPSREKRHPSLFSNEKGKNITITTVKFYTEGFENSDLICSHWQPPCLGLSLNCQQVSASRDTCTGKKMWATRKETGIL